ncbi:NACHT domain-containing protein [Candidatus Tisiphia endosymbiont of Oplodontha viridula]|uniref:NACHT domain-containing protein n=1 Tax=Candidatus Tisiphia endosymbiont of Oplodontha viridula TaxID=3077925 RepID=UPI0035C90B79
MTFQDKLKEIYKKQDKIVQLIEGLDEIPQQAMQDYYVKLQTVIREDEEKRSSVYESIAGEKQKIEVENIFDKLSETSNDKNPSKLLILGAAGVGKSTLMQYMAHQWSIGEIWSGKFDYVYRVNLKTLLNDDWQKSYLKTYDMSNGEDVLKCLVHYSLTRYLTPKERRDLGVKVEDLELSEGKSKILLLLDGYDEVAHLRSQDDYKELDYAIFEHKNIIITSRPNAVDKEMKKNFDRIIENTGLDNKGIELYFTKYFRKDTEEGGIKGEELQTFLNGNTVIKGICHIPVNIAMLCYIWSEGESNTVLQEISNMSDLYSQVVQQLGFRYFAKWKYDGPKRDKKELKDIWKGKAVNLSELKILQHTAYKSTTGGGIEVDDKKRVETLIIKGMQSKSDKDGISIQSSIDYLRQFLKKNEQITIVDVYRYGLLKSIAVKPEELNSPTQQLQTRAMQQQVVSDTELLQQNYEFIHLTFQEYLTANYFKEMLEHGNDQQKKEICQFIAEHRNDPRYLMMLKFMAGIVTADRSEDGNKISQIFWESVTCNIDGVIELGIEAKINLLMHLLGQAKGKGGIDDRIPNRASILQLIDVVVLKDLLAWGNQLKETDYISENIKLGLLAGLSEGSLDFDEKIQEIKGKATLELKAAIEIVTKAETINADKNIIISSCIEIVSNIINKFTTQEQTDVITKLKEIIAKETTTGDWQLTKQAIDGLAKIAMQVNLTMLTKEDSEELIKMLVSKIKDTNYEQAAVKSIAELLSSIKNHNLTIKTIKQFSELLLDGDSKVKKAAARSTSELVKSIEDKGLVKELIVKFRTLLLDKDWTVRREAVKGAIELVKSIEDKELVKEFIANFSKLFANQDNGVREEVAKGTIELVKAIKNEELVKGLIEKFSKLFADQNGEVRATATRNISGLVKCIKDQTLVEKLIDQLSTLLADVCGHVREAVVQSACELVKCIKDQTIVEKLIDQLSILLVDSDHVVRNHAVWRTNELVKCIKDQMLVKKLIDKSSTLLGNANSIVRSDAVWSISELMKCIEDQQLIRTFLDKFITLLADKDHWVRFGAVRATSELVKSIEDQQLLRTLLDKFITLLADENSDVRSEVASATSELVKSIEDQQLLRTLLDKFSTLLADEGSVVRSGAVKVTSELVTAIKDEELVKKLIEKFNELLADKDSSVRQAAAWNISELVEHIVEKKELVWKLVGTLNTLLTDSTNNVSGNIIELVRSIQNTKLIRKLIDTLNTLLTDSTNAVKYTTQETSELVKIQDKYSTLVKKLIEKLSVFLENPGNDMPVILGGLEIMTKNLLLPLEKFKEYLNHQNKEIRKLTISSLIEPFKDFLTKCELLEELVKGKQNLTIKIIEKKLFDNNLAQDLRDQILKSLSNLANSRDQDIKDTTLLELNNISNVKSHELIKFALLVRGQEDISKADSSKKELVELAKKVINYQIEHLSDAGRKWINDNFENLLSLSKESKMFITQLYHKILENLVITELEKELIIKFINQGIMVVSFV